MITTQWWVLPTVFFAGTGIAAILAGVLRSYIDSLVLARVAAHLEALLAAEPAPADPGLPPQVDPWLSWQTLHDGLPDTTAPEVPEHTWWGKGTGPSVILPPPAVPQPEVEAKTKSNPRKRFEEPKPPVELAITTTVGDRVLTDRIEVPS